MHLPFSDAMDEEPPLGFVLLIWAKWVNKMKMESVTLLRYSITHVIQVVALFPERFMENC